MKIGDKFNHLTIIQESNRRAANGGKYWICRCDCGNITEVRADHLKSGHTKSCGCQAKKNINNILGQHFNNLTVIEQTDRRRSGGDVIWKCRCDCGNITYASASELRNGRIKSCGCLKSVGEQRIEQLLLQNNITFQKQYCFSDLKDEGFLRFDFAIFKNDQLQYLIEYDGDIHFNNKGAWNGKIDYEVLHKHDIMKNQYCKEHNIPLIRIPYTHLQKLNLSHLLITSNFLLKDK